MIILKIIYTHCIFSIIPQNDDNPEEDREQVGAYLKEIDFYQLHQSHKLIDLSAATVALLKKKCFSFKNMFLGWWSMSTNESNVWPVGRHRLATSPIDYMSFLQE